MHGGFLSTPTKILSGALFLTQFYRGKGGKPQTPAGDVHAEIEWLKISGRWNYRGVRQEERKMQAQQNKERL
jgi:hypothetical protein